MKEQGEMMNIRDIIYDNGQVDIESDNFVIESNYTGKYADLSSEHEAEMVTMMSDRPWKDVIAESFKDHSPWLYKIITDTGRSLFLDVLDIPKNGLYLDVGSGWGQVCIPLGRYGNSVALDLTYNRLNILKSIATQESVPLQYVQGNFLSFPFLEGIFDAIVFNGSLEWIGVGREEGASIREVQIEALKKAYRLLKPGGMIYIGIENSMGLKYILGAADDHTGLIHHTFLEEKLAEVNFLTKTDGEQLPSKTWSLEEYKEMIGESGLELEKVYGCFPDYKLIRQMIDLRSINEVLKKGLPVLEHLGTNGISFEKNNELNEIYKVLSKNKIAQSFCPSYGFILRKRS
ncbi:class I SAM-dependent methyltransferase [Paenibacillus agricola]|uniref:Methyltransferase domain-containing protein n=1 Tax=Paenibacillus agricola TaxID=2716264 RepID=A0ABX0JHV8_9BACL|nr:class I SAM-dependent methyltransferase [Paenibacillus agricola]NHN34273.1 methyltransferase domain-containing protein [Paenibacillus agricola]